MRSRTVTASGLDAAAAATSAGIDKAIGLHAGSDDDFPERHLADKGFHFRGGGRGGAAAVVHPQHERTGVGRHAEQAQIGQRARPPIGATRVAFLGVKPYHLQVVVLADVEGQSVRRGGRRHEAVDAKVKLLEPHPRGIGVAHRLVLGDLKALAGDSLDGDVS